MKKIILLPAILAALMFSSCVNEELENNDNLDLSSSDIAFAFGGTTTRAAVSAAIEEETGVSISLGTESGTEFFLKETVEELNPTGLATRGTPVYNENVTKIKEYRSFEAVAYLQGATEEYTNGTATFSSMDYQKEVEGREGWIYKHQYGGTLPWPEGQPTKDIYFFLRMPTSYIDDNLKENTQIAYDSNTGTIAFDYVSPQSGDAQKDILFTSRTLNQTQYENNYMETGAPVTMYHALTGVKFRVGNNNSGTTKTIITHVELSGLKDVGHCIVTPSSGKVQWTPEEEAIFGSFAMDFDNPTYSQTSDNTITYVKPSGSSEGSSDDSSDDSDKPMEFGNSWYAPGKDTNNPTNTNNLNDANGTKTFWLIPQEIPDDAVLTVKFRVKTPDTPTGAEITHTITDFGARLKKSKDSKVEWKAGQIRTFTLEPEDVDVDIFDQMTGYVKNNLHVTNTGNVDEYVRMMLMGNWYGWLPDQDPATVPASMLVGYTTSDTSNETMVTNWFGRAEPYSLGFDETFAGGKPNAAKGNPWIFGTGSYYYYPYVIGVGETLSQTAALFQTYTLNPTWIPDIWIPVGGTRQKAKGVHLVFECVVQAISTKDANGQPYADWMAAWSAATGQTIGVKN